MLLSNKKQTTNALYNNVDISQNIILIEKIQTEKAYTALSQFYETLLKHYLIERVIELVRISSGWKVGVSYK